MTIFNLLEPYQNQIEKKINMHASFKNFSWSIKLFSTQLKVFQYADFQTRILFVVHVQYEISPFSDVVHAFRGLI